MVGMTYLAPLVLVVALAVGGLVLPAHAGTAPHLARFRNSQDRNAAKTTAFMVSPYNRMTVRIAA